MLVSRHYLTRNSGKVGSNRFNMLFSPFHDSCVQEQCYKERVSHCWAESLVKGELMYHSQIMGMNHDQVKESKSCDCCLHRFLSECTM